MVSEASARSLAVLRDTSHISWMVIPMLLVVLYVYFQEVENGRMSRVLAGLAFWGMDWFNEIWNGLVFHFTGYAPVWGAPGRTAYLILIGLNVEICFMFAIAGITFSKMLPHDRKLKVFGVPNRLFIAVAGSIFCVFVELLLHAAGALTWDYAWWGANAPWLIFLIGYLPFFLVAFAVHDMATVRQKALTTAGILGFDLLGLAVFGGLLGWI